jgi:hypothetical protein
MVILTFNLLSSLLEPTPTLYNMGLTLMPTCLNFDFFGKNPSMKRKGF